MDNPTEQHTATILAVLQGKESLYTVNIDRALYTQLYQEAHSLYRDHHIAILTESGYTIQQHAPKWSRKVR